MSSSHPVAVDESPPCLRHGHPKSGNAQETTWPRLLPDNELRAEIAALLRGRDLEALSLGDLRRELECRLGLPERGLHAQRHAVKALAREAVEAAAIAREAAAKAARASKKRGAPAAETPVTSRPFRTFGSATPAKRKRPSNSYSLYIKDRFVFLEEQLAAKSGTKPRLADVMKVASELWRTMPSEDRDQYEQRAAAGRASDKAAIASGVFGMPSEQEPMQRAVRGPITRADFLKLGPRLRIVADVESGNSEERRANPPVEAPPNVPEVTTPAEADVQAFPRQTVSLAPRTFKTGTVGWYGTLKMPVSIAGHSVDVQMQVTFTVGGSRSWADGAAVLPSAGGDNEAHEAVVVVPVSETVPCVSGSSAAAVWEATASNASASDGNEGRSKTETTATEGCVAATQPPDLPATVIASCSRVADRSAVATSSLPDVTVTAATGNDEVAMLGSS
eukprot:TRINITY_DN51711_c0_g1_i1.p1 TRINITY_DN51711_c0_g1~~TRINITY_DN51711_c0_g1_i1.p1  ORF type:complete len:468 (+),score=70.20 TRINITY_DN51711_c0_g1_i1:59-1405(+)